VRRVGERDRIAGEQTRRNAELARQAAEDTRNLGEPLSPPKRTPADNAGPEKAQRPGPDKLGN
jgi:hypothetical protein